MASMKFSMRLTLLVTALLLIGSLIGAGQAKAAVWVATETWDDSFEAKYAAWTEAELDESFFLKGDWAGIKTDCADVIYGSRIIFSYLNSLPFKLGVNDTRFNEKTTAFDHIADPVQRVRAFLDFVNDKTWTGSLATHTYSIAMTRKSVQPGVIWMKPGHVEIVRHVRATGVVELRGSWLPGAIRKMITITNLGNVPRKTTLGFRRWIWPQNFGLPTTEQPGYDDSQFRLLGSEQMEPLAAEISALDQYYEVARFEGLVQKALALHAESEASRTQRLAQDFCALVGSRSEVVRTGYEFSSKLERCLNKTEYHAYSTPSRDSSLRRVVFGLGLHLKNNLNAVTKALSACPPILISDTRSVRADEFLRKLLTLNFSSNPHEKPEARFGLSTPERLCISDGDDSTD